LTIRSWAFPVNALTMGRPEDTPRGQRLDASPSDVGDAVYASCVDALDAPLAVIDASRRLAITLQPRLDASLAELGISYAQFELLERIEHDADAHAAELARALGCSRQAVSTLLAKLIRSDLVDLAPLDLGVRVPVITDVGRRRAGQASTALRRTMQQIGSAPAEDLVAFVRTATSIRTAIRRGDPGW
jgi:DNA-binding MarR family transcriptional regulator